MNRDLAINILLIVAGIVLAIALFGAGLFWRGKMAPKTSGLPKAQSNQVIQQVNCCNQASLLWAFRSPFLGVDEQSREQAQWP